MAPDKTKKQGEHHPAKRAAFWWSLFGLGVLIAPIAHSYHGITALFALAALLLTAAYAAKASGGYRATPAIALAALSFLGPLAIALSQPHAQEAEPSSLAPAWILGAWLYGGAVLIPLLFAWAFKKGDNEP